MFVMQEEKCRLFHLFKNYHIIDTKWIFKNKLDEHRGIIKNKERLVAQGYSQEMGINHEETFAPMTRLESIWMLLAFAGYHNFTLQQMDVKSAFFNRYIKEEVYVK